MSAPKKHNKSTKSPVRTFASVGAYIISNDIRDIKTAQNIKSFLSSIGISLQTSAPYTPTEKDVAQMSSYGKYMMLYCQDRFAHEQFSYMGALGAFLAWRHVWRTCAKQKEHDYFLIFEGNSILDDPEMLVQCLDAALEHRLDLVKLAVDSSGEYCPKRKKVHGEVVADLTRGKLRALVRPKTNAKGYILSRRFCKYLASITKEDIPPLHVDFFATLEASPYGSGMFRGAEYFPKSNHSYVVSWDTRKKGYDKNQIIKNHHTPICYRGDWDVLR